MALIELLENEIAKNKCVVDIRLTQSEAEMIVLLLKKHQEPQVPVHFTEPRYGMGYEYYDWKCPTCGKFLAYEPDIKGIPNRCTGCGQLLSMPEER